MSDTTGVIGPAEPTHRYFLENGRLVSEISKARFDLVTKYPCDELRVWWLPAPRRIDAEGDR